MDTLYRFHALGSPPMCPACHQVLPIRGELRSLSLQVRPPHRGPGSSVETRCFLRVCTCGLALAVQPLQDGFNFAFRCRGCDCFTPEVNSSGHCLCCILERNVGINDARALIDTLSESDPCLGQSRSDFLDGFLKGILLGVPDLLVP